MSAGSQLSCVSRAASPAGAPRGHDCSAAALGSAGTASRLFLPGLVRTAQIPQLFRRWQRTYSQKVLLPSASREGAEGPPPFPVQMAAGVLNAAGAGNTALVSRVVYKACDDLRAAPELRLPEA